MALAALVVVLPALLSGCKPSAEVGGPEAPTRVRFWHTFNADEARTVGALIEDFERENPGVEVEVTVLPFGAAHNRLRAAMRAGQGPDVARAEVAWIPALADEGLLMPLGARGPRLEEHLEVVRPFARWRSEVFAFPQGVDALVLYTNRRLFERAGVEVPQTWDQLLEAARRLTIDSGGRSAAEPGFERGAVVQHGITLKTDGYYFLPLLWAFGGGTVDPEAGEVFIDSAGSVAAAAFLVRLARGEGVAPERLDFTDEYRAEIEGFGQGRVAMIINGPWAALDLLKGPAFADPLDLVASPVPLGEGGRGGSPVGGHGYVINKASGAQEAALALASHLSSLRAQVMLAQANHLLPTRLAAYEQPEVRSDRLVVAFRAALDRSHPRAVFPGMARLFDALTPALQKLVRGEGAPEAVMPAVAAQWRLILKPPR